MKLVISALNKSATFFFSLTATPWGDCIKLRIKSTIHQNVYLFDSSCIWCSSFDPILGFRTNNIMNNQLCNISIILYGN